MRLYLRHIQGTVGGVFGEISNRNGQEMRTSLCYGLLPKQPLRYNYVYCIYFVNLFRYLPLAFICYCFGLQTKLKEKMNELKNLNAEAYEYMASIPSNAWCRYAFDTVCKSNMLLNNICESFNAVLKSCRDKVVLTHME